MSINSALLSGVSGLVANSTALASISDNIANVNTVGYKRRNTDFQDLVTSKAGSGRYNAGGVLANTHHLISQQGNTLQSTSSTDLAIAGSGFFVVTEKSLDAKPSDARLFTRAGSFTPDKQGYLRNSAGYYLQGWPTQADGTINADPSDLTRLSPFNVSGVSGRAEPTTKIALTANLKSGQAISPELAAYDPTANSMSVYDAEAGTGTKPDFQIQIPISDSKGTQRTIAISFIKTGAPPEGLTGDGPNEWYAEVHAVPADSVTTVAPAPAGQLAAGKVVFTADGRLDPAATTLFTGGELALTIGASDGSSAPGPRWAAGLGVAEQRIAFDLGKADGGLTQYDNDSSTTSISTNGTNFGALKDVEFSEDGDVTAIFDNGITRKLGRVALATFANPDGLRALSGDVFRVSQESGSFILKRPGESGAGVLSPSALEASTVDLSTEFTGLIVTQRAYSASSKIITTADEMLEQLISLKR